MQNKRPCFDVELFHNLLLEFKSVFKYLKNNDMVGRLNLSNCILVDINKLTVTCGS
jgi:hypothetical protein